MIDTKIILKTGETIIGPIWLWRPKEGYVQIVGHDDFIYLRDVKEASTGGRDELERAQKEGWTRA